jgi:long-chain acyl-CoA synthetase
MFLFLPLAHSFARLINYLGALTPVEICFCGVANKKKTVVDLVQVAAEMSSCGANVVPSVPRLFEKMKSSLESPKPGIQGILIKLTLSTAGQFWNPIYWLLSPIRKKIRKKIFGTNFSHAISGGAKLPPSITAFFKNLGINIYEGYGLTETCVATNVNLPNKWRIGSVGPAFDKVEIKISEDGEILFKGPNITSGYWNRPLATAESWDQLGWFHTGDIGHLDKDGFLYITDRKKDLIVTAGGKKIPPLKVESLLLSYSIISQSIYYGDAKPFCIALVYLSPDAKNDPNITEKLEIIRKEINSQLASFESIKKIIQLPYELTIENGMLTPTLKIKRKVVVEKFSKLIEEQYK